MTSQEDQEQLEGRGFPSRKLQPHQTEQHKQIIHSEFKAQSEAKSNSICNLKLTIINRIEESENKIKFAYKSPQIANRESSA